MSDEPEETQLAAAKLAQTIVFTSQGTPFMFAGEEIFRDKKGIHNSYNKPDSINAIDWENKTKYRDQFDYYKGLTSLRRQHPAFRMTSAEDIAQNLVFDEVDSEQTPNLISYSLKNHANGDKWEEIKVVLNGASYSQKIELPKANWKIISYDGKINPDEGLGSTEGGEMTLPPYSALILAKE